jgi:hypothetical protein
MGLGGLLARPSRLPLRRPSHELLLLALVAFVALSPVNHASDPDASRLCLSRAMVHGRLTISPCIGDSVDWSHYDGRIYSDKAPGMSVISIPFVEAVRLRSPDRWVSSGDLRVWAVHVLTTGVAYLLLAAAVGRVAEGLAQGCGGFALVAFALGTLVGPLAESGFGHVPAAALAFWAFLLVGRGRPGYAGCVAGLAISVDYPAAAVAAILAFYTTLAGRRALVRYLAGMLPALVLLGAYDWAAFGSPFHLSYDYLGNPGAAEGQSSGLLGVGLPVEHAVHEVFIGDRGLLVASPILVAALAGIVLVGRRYGPEALVCAVVAAVFIAANCSYYLPYGGTSPGPRFLTPMLPFLALGLGPAFARWRVPTTLLATASVAATTALTLTWASAMPYPGTVWHQIVEVISRGRASPIARQLTNNLLTWAGPSRSLAAVFVAVSAGAAVLISAGRRNARTS